MNPRLVVARANPAGADGLPEESQAARVEFNEAREGTAAARAACPRRCESSRSRLE